MGVLGQFKAFWSRLPFRLSLHLPYSSRIKVFFMWMQLPTVGGCAACVFPQEALVAAKLYVGNLSYGVSDSALEAMFAPFGTVQSAQVIMDRDTGRSKGFGFVEMGSSQEAQAAIDGMNGKEVDGRKLTVNDARPREERRGGGGGGGGRGGYGGGGGKRY